MAKVSATPTVLRMISNDFIAVGVESGEIQFLDARAGIGIVSSVTAHRDYISSLSLLPGKSRPQVISTGESTMSISDMRKGLIDESEDQQDELLSSTFFEGRKPRVLTGGSTGFLTLFEMGHWGYGISQVNVGKDSVDSLIPVENMLLVSGGDGLRLVDVDAGITRNTWASGQEIACLDVKDGWIFAGMDRDLSVWRYDEKVEQKNKRAKKSKAKVQNSSMTQKTFFAEL